MELRIKIYPDTEADVHRFIKRISRTDRHAIVIQSLRAYMKTYPELFASDEIISDDVNGETTGPNGGPAIPASSSVPSPGIGDHPSDHQSSGKKGKRRVEAAAVKKPKQAAPPAPAAGQVPPEQPAPPEANPPEANPPEANPPAPPAPAAEQPDVVDPANIPEEDLKVMESIFNAFGSKQVEF